MPRNGSGTFNRIHDWTDDAAAAIKISSTRMDAEMDGMATALTDSIAKDGQTTPTANLPMGNFKHTGVANATARTHYAAAGQVQDSSMTTATAGGTADAITLSLSPAITAYAAGQMFQFIASGTNTGAVTLNVSGVGATAVKKAGGNALVAGDIVSGQAALVQHDGTDFELLNPAAVTIAGAQTVTGDKTFSGTLAMSAKPINTAVRVDVASATTVNLDTAASNYVRITGTTTITGVTLTDGRWREVVFDGALTLTHGASLILHGSANITTAAGDTCRMMGEASGVVRVTNYQASAVPPFRGLLRQTAIATTSGTSHDFTSIPSGVKRITLALSDVSTDGTSPVIFQIGTSGGFTTSGYKSVSDSYESGPSFAHGGSGFSCDDLSAETAGRTRCGIATLVNITGNTWVWSGQFGSGPGTNTIHQGAGFIALSGTLDRLRMTTVAGSQNFDGGTYNVLYEF